MVRWGTLLKTGLGVAAGLGLVLALDPKTRARLEEEFWRGIGTARLRVDEYRRILRRAIEEGRAASRARESELRGKLESDRHRASKSPDYIL